jgi:hypothetical protein
VLSPLVALSSSIPRRLCALRFFILGFSDRLLAARGAEDFRALRAHRPPTKFRPCRARTLSGSSHAMKSLSPKRNLLEARRERYRNEKMSSRLFPWQVLPCSIGFASSST